MRRGQGERLLLACLLGVSLASGCGGKKEGVDKAKAASVEPKSSRTPVETIKIDAVDFTQLVRLTGETEANESITVSAEIPGLVLETNFEEGATVEAGQWLARIDARIDRARAVQLEENLRQSELDHLRAVELEKKGLATTSDVERARMVVANNRSTLNMTRMGVGKSSMSAPIRGVVDKKYMHKGEYANPGQPLVRIVNLETIVVRAGLPESQLRHVREGTRLRVEVPALELVREGVVRRVGAQANTKNRTFPVEVVVENEDRAVRAGMRAIVEMPTQRIEDALLVPREVVLDTPKGPMVYVVEGGVASRKEVKLGPDRDDYVVLVAGVGVGAEIVRVGQHSLPRSAEVEVVGSSACCGEALKGEKGEAQ